MKTLKFFLLTALCVFFVNSCDNLFNHPDLLTAGSLPAGKGYFSLKIADAAGRTITPEGKVDYNALFYELVFTSMSDGGRETVNLTTLAEPVVLDIGTYNVVVNAYGDADRKNLLFSGTVDGIEITSGETAAATVYLEPILEGGAGTFSWNITLPADVVSASMVITDRKTKTPAADAVTLKTAATGSRELRAGFYDVVVTITGRNDKLEGDVTVTRKEVLHIYNGRESIYKPNFGNIDFNIVYEVKIPDAAGEYTSKYVVHGAPIPEDYFSGDYLAGNGYAPSLDGVDAYLYEGEAPAKPGYVFGGWYTDEDLVDKWEQSTPVTEDLTLYPQWSNGSIKSGFEDIVDYINSIGTSGGASAGEYTLFIAEDVTLGKTLTIKTGVTLTVTSANASTVKTILRGFADTNNSGLFVVDGNNAELTLENIVIDGNHKTDGNENSGFASNKASLVRINGGTFTMNNGAVLRNNRASSGGGVYVNGGTFTMSGGIIGGTTPDDGNEATSSGGGGVYVGGGGEFTMSGIAVISGNKALNLGTLPPSPVSPHGGGVHVNGGKFTMKMGTISGNTADDSGGGVCVRGSSSSKGTFNMEDGAIGGTAPAEGNTANNGGGVCVDDYGEFTMEKGTISGNTAYAGGGVYIYGDDNNNPGTFTMKGSASVSGNTADFGGGVYVNGMLKLGGIAVIKENYDNDDPATRANSNVYLTNGKSITLDPTIPLESPAEIWVQTETQSGVIVQSGATSGSEQCFHADNYGAVAFDSSSNSLVLKNPTGNDKLVFTPLPTIPHTASRRTAASTAKSLYPPTTKASP